MGLHPHGSSDDGLRDDNGEYSTGLARPIGGSNSIENIWVILKRRVKQLGPETNEELVTVIVTAREGIEVPLANKLTDLMPERHEEVMRNEGGHISYRINHHQ
jgi:hypothetical protein